MRRIRQPIEIGLGEFILNCIILAIFIILIVLVGFLISPDSKYDPPMSEPVEVPALPDSGPWALGGSKNYAGW